MARIRTIKPTHWNDKELSKICLQAHLLWIGLWNFSDDEGVFENDPYLIKSQIFPRRTDIRTEQVTQWLDQLNTARFIIPFAHEGIGYYIHRTFKTHQKIDRPQPSKIPLDVIRRIFDESSPNVRPCIVEDSKVEESRASPPDLMLGSVTYNAEETILAAQARLEQICMKTSFDLPTAKDSLHKYHLHLEEKEQYPKGKKAVFAGFEKWLSNERKFSNSGSTTTIQPTPASISIRDQRGQELLNSIK